jgi:hypothetical protein
MRSVSNKDIHKSKKSRKVKSLSDLDRNHKVSVKPMINGWTGQNDNYSNRISISPIRHKKKTNLLLDHEHIQTEPSLHINPQKKRPNFLSNLFINVNAEPDITGRTTNNNALAELISDFKTLNHDKEELLEVANSVYQSEYNNQESVYEFIRNTIETCGKPIAVHQRKQFDILPHPRYSMFVYKDRNKNTAIKIYNYECTPEADFAILQEIVWQKYAERISNICQMKTPTIIQYGRCKNEKLSENFMYNCFFFIEMEWMDMPTLDKQYDNINGNAEKCNSVADRINGVQQCMEDKGLYHNDFHHQNVLLDFNGTNRNNINVGVLDYGRSGSVPYGFENLNIYKCDKEHRLKTRRTASSKGGYKRRRSRRNRKH